MAKMLSLNVQSMLGRWYDWHWYWCGELSERITKSTVKRTMKKPEKMILWALQYMLNWSQMQSDKDDDNDV